MNNAPILVLQMQRMGDIILSFPLLSVLQRKYPHNPLWTVAEPHFFTQLHAFAPQTVFFPPHAFEKLKTTSYHSIINLSHRGDAAHMAGMLRAEQHFGAYTRHKHTHIGGDWALYRASIVHNNRHNLLHWSDIHQLDHAQRPISLAPVALKNASRKVGIFVGANEKEKRPEPEFFGELARQLLRKDLKPLFFGGPNDVALGEAARRHANMPGGNMCGKLTLKQLGEIFTELDILITPDTGPMHLAAWVGTPVCNLSLGMVNPWETGPHNAGHYILTPHLSCVGCWRCTRTQQRCKDLFHAGRVARVVEVVLSEQTRLKRIVLSGLMLYKTARTAQGLYELHAQCGTPPTHRHLVSTLWRAWFYDAAFDPTFQATHAALCALYTQAPALMTALHTATVRLGQHMARHLFLRSKGKHTPLPESFWQGQAPLIRPLAGHMQLYVDNAEGSLTAWEHMLARIQCLAQLLQKTA